MVSLYHLWSISEDHFDLSFNYFQHIFCAVAGSVSAHSHGHSHAHAINYENIGQTLCQRTRIQVSLRRVLCHRPLVLNLKYLSQYFRYTLPKLYFVCSPSSARLFPSLRYSNSAGTGDRHGHTQAHTHTYTRTHAHTYCAILIVCVFELRRVWFGLAASWTLHLLLQLLWLPHFLLLWCLLLPSQFYTVFLFSYPTNWQFFKIKYSIQLRC